MYIFSRNTIFTLVVSAAISLLFYPETSAAFVPSVLDSTTETSRYSAASAISLCPSSAITSWNCAYCNNFPVSNVAYTASDTTGMSFFVAVADDLTDIIVSFNAPSSVSLEDMTNSNLVPLVVQNSADFYAALVSEDLNNLYNSIRTQLTARLKSFIGIKPNYDLVFVGHGVGGGIAHLAAVLAVKAGQVPASKVKVRTFNSPRVGNIGFAVLSTGINFIRYTQSNDGWSNVPPRYKGFLHAGSQVNFIGVNANVCLGSIALENPYCSSKATADYAHYDFSRNPNYFASAC